MRPKIGSKPAQLAPWLLAAVTLLGGGLRVYALSSKGLWIDEAFSVWMGRQALPEIGAWLVKIDQHPPLYYTLLHFWLALGDRAAVVRLLSALLGTLTLPVIYALGRRLGGPAAGLLAALVLALSPFHVRLAQEARMYTLLALNASLAMLALAHLLTDPRAADVPLGSQLRSWFGAWRSTGRLPALSALETDLAWLAYIVFSAGAVLSHNTAVLLPLAANLFVAGFVWLGGTQQGKSGFRPPSLRNWALAQLGLFLLWVPWLPAFVIQATGVYRAFWLPQPGWHTVAGTLATFLSDLLPGQAPWAGLAWTAFLLLIVLGIAALRARPALLALLLTLFVVPVAGELLVSQVRPIFYDRTLIWATIPLYLLLAAGLERLHYRPAILAGLAFLLLVNGASLRAYYLHYQKEQWSEAATYVGQNVQAGDMLLFNATWAQIPFDFYYRHAGPPLPEHGAPVDLFARGVLEPKMAPCDLPRLRELVRGRRHVWLIYSHHWYTDPQGLVPAALGQQLKLLERRAFYGVDVLLYGE